MTGMIGNIVVVGKRRWSVRRLAGLARRGGDNSPFLAFGAAVPSVR
ncbi:MAG: hypothetical protein QGH42_05725 [Kiritimatiellia bacterium]|nr:hypothetical protein [Kiritimatiellia bacterium]MDP7023732.1 hypothetical protein [Kiritimatiellia bacterium]